jgi:hypothetical protein
LEGLCTDLKAWDELALELDEANKTGNILYDSWCRPMLQKVMFGHGRMVSIWGDNNANKLNPLWEKNGSSLSSALSNRAYISITPN